MVFARKVESQTLTFGVSGKLIMNALVMYDHETESLWSQFLSEAVEGDLQGTKLELLPALQTNWSTWVELHPDTLALDKGGRFTRDPYQGYYAAEDAGVIGETRQDDRLYVKEFVIGLERDGMARAYPFSVLNDVPIVNDTFGDDSVLIVFDAESGGGAGFHRSLEMGTLTFELKEGSSEDSLLMVDRETETLWKALTGEAIEGPLSGTTLEQLPTTLSFWFGWKDFYPDTEIYGQ